MSDESTFQVQFWKLTKRTGRSRPWGVRWRTAGREHSEWYATKALAESFRSELVRAGRAGEAFDVAYRAPAVADPQAGRRDVPRAGRGLRRPHLADRAAEQPARRGGQPGRDHAEVRPPPRARPGRDRPPAAREHPPPAAAAP